MHVYYKFGLFLIFIVSMSKNFTQAFPSSNQTNSSDYNYDGDYYDDVDETTTNHPTSTTYKPTISKNFLTDLFDSSFSDSNQSLDKEEDQLQRTNETPKCPNNCICQNYNTNVSCSGMDLTTIPTDIPPTAERLDLSHNKITEIPVGVFSSNSKLKEINLDGNMIAHIDKEVFSSLPNLDYLSLANNKLTDVAADTFTEASELRVLNLSNNSIVLPTEGSFLNQPVLRELLLRNSSLTELYDETFSNLSGLHVLKMDGNSFNKKINTLAFQPLKELIKLKLPELHQDNIEELCNVLKAIDNISLKRFDISCFQLVNGDTFNQSLIFVTDAPSLIPTKTTASTTSKPTMKSVNASAVAMDVMTNANLSELEPSSDGGAAAMEGTELPHILATTASSSTEKAAYQVPISQEAINYALISIIVIAVIGLIIGFICRKDFGGIKTKCCRTRKPPPGDQVRPAEEIPLNKIG
ncbi:leucine-rich repeat and immunoglobulin-like domain-containing nogo receptor-interacting protein 2 [Eupeodes corollae]|uniref:leucine-rich repeat and immunoglobulin-like domain-containing nogo receptor-interacting protein 2 n=1 Tax=Eupeodes corollae TaxID=290404 RepID=UPI00248F5DFB|nr:leucine-rich repeat and immunoglobulin-like domain-containing nogo receptor-interacting protein 2 [Eupeodes corollae]XP_055906102.1 leucine-rich repeat and immunoglobulin-like domain-containing nogo receptor-interacting protein 2 [Eupeodes corollae]XP_055906103.1 leucine-rich repeat and immunoglobulin-like domain-containing nogo receptor-interacting protein 2 [Eupeodes corollae]XP_055906104.1 leucine-rich repeat and immunoglobulin-like domain-containing nogo receptor-interacting protein 2 [Eu